jgi:SNF2 family DNA or RNA helicase
VTLQRFSADVRVSEALDGLVVLPTGNAEPGALARRLKQLRPGIRLHRVGRGLKVPPSESPTLQAIDGQTELRWSPEAVRFAQNRAAAAAAAPDVRAAVQSILRGGRASADEILGASSYPHLDAHQRVNVAAMTVEASYGLCLFDEQGAGKTVSLIFAFDRLVERRQADFLLIVAPKSMLGEWQADFRRFMGDLYKVTVIAGSPAAKRELLSNPCDVAVVNFETAVQMERSLAGMLRRWGARGVLAVDESFHVKSLDAKRTKAIRRLREYCGRAFVLCGTPAPNAPGDLVQQFNMVDFGITFDGVDVPKDRDEAARVIQGAIDARGVFVRHLKAEVLPSLPGKTFTRVPLSLEPEQRRLYDEAARGLIRDLQATDEEAFRRQLASFLARRTALLQICSSPAAVVPGYTELPAKIRALDSLLNELISRRGEKVVLWSFFTASLDTLVERYRAFNPVRYDGSVVSVEARRTAVKQFQEGDVVRLFVGNPAAAGAGLTLHRARYAVYESLSNQAAHYLQSLDRIHRRGQDRAVEYFLLVCEGTLEEDEYRTLLDKERRAQHLLRDRPNPPMTRDAMLRELLGSRE